MVDDRAQSNAQTKAEGADSHRECVVSYGKRQETQFEQFALYRPR